MIHIRYLGTQPYLDVWEEMKRFTKDRNESTPDEIWILQHPSVYTQGQAGKAEHILNPQMIPIVQSDRGGQVTYHGPGQIVAYVLIDIRRRNLGIRSLVCLLEKMLISLLKHWKIEAQCREEAPGVYVSDKKIASIGLRVKNGCTYHGVALNVAMNLEPFNGINPCGYARLKMTQMQDFLDEIQIEQVIDRMVKEFLTFFTN
jgi:lipoyl(octanoyl) transferase